MSLQKVGTPESIKVTGGLNLDPNLVTKEIIKTWKSKEISLDELHEFVKRMGVVDYSSEDMNHVVRMLQSSGFVVKS
jgi:hypothetical protein